MKALLVVASILVASPAAAGVCPGDSINALTLYLDSIPCGLHAATQAVLRHNSGTHATCPGYIYTNVTGNINFSGVGPMFSGTTTTGHSTSHGRSQNEFSNGTRVAGATWHVRNSQIGYASRTTFVFCSSGDPGNMPCPPGFTECTTRPSGCCANGCPLILDRGNDGVQMSNAENGALLDINGMGAFLWWGWQTDPDNDPWFALDRNGDGIINDGSELFGNTRYLANGMKPTNGYEVLAELDANNDGLIDRRDPRFKKILLWADRNRNGLSEPSELSGLVENGVISVSTKPGIAESTDKHGNRIKYHSLVMTKNGPTRSVDMFPVWTEP